MWDGEQLFSSGEHLLLAGDCHTGSLAELGCWYFSKQIQISVQVQPSLYGQAGLYIFEHLSWLPALALFLSFRALWSAELDALMLFSF